MRAGRYFDRPFLFRVIRNRNAEVDRSTVSPRGKSDLPDPDRLASAHASRGALRDGRVATLAVGIAAAALAATEAAFPAARHAACGAGLAATALAALVVFTRPGRAAAGRPPRHRSPIATALLLAVSAAAFGLGLAEPTPSGSAAGWSGLVARAALVAWTGSLVVESLRPRRPLRDRGSRVSRCLSRMAELRRIASAGAARADAGGAGGASPFDPVVREIREAFGFRSAALFLRDGDGADLVPAARSGSPLPPAAASDCVRSAARTGRALWRTGNGRSEMASPIALEGRVEGALHLVAAAEEPFGAEDVATADALGKEIGALLAATRRADAEAPVAARPSDAAKERARAAELSRLTELLETERAAAIEERRRLAMLFETVPEGVLAVDADSRVTHMNARAEAIFGRRLADSPGLTLDALDSGGEIRALRARVREGERGGASDELASIGVPPEDGRPRRYHVTVSEPPSPAGSSCVVLRDVTRERELEQMKTDFLSNVCHELRTPLTAIVGFSELFHDEDLGALNSEQKECVGRIMTQAQHLLGIINNLLDLSRLEAGRVVIEPENLPVEDVVRDVSVNLSTLFDAKRIECRVDLPEAPLPLVRADRQKVNQILFNLVNNAIKFSPAGGRVTLGARENGAHVEVTVSDNGIGIPADKLPRLFERFYRADEKRSRGTPGTGLGLAIVKEIVELLGGSVRCESEPGKGSAFTFSLPIATAEAVAAEALPAPLPAPPAAPPAAPSEKRRKVLVVDDRPEVRMLVTVKLRKRFDVLAAENGLEAVEVAREKKPDLVLMDMMMPVMDGISATRTLKSDPATRDIEIWAFTARALEDELARAREAGCSDVVTKPFDPAALFDKVSAHFERLDAASVPAPAPGSPRARRPLVLLVDDDVEAHRLVGYALWSEGFDVASIDRGHEAIVLAKKCRPSAILLDIQLPDTDGFSVLEKLKSDPETAAIPVFIFSVVPDMKRGFALGAVDYLPKPFNGDRLVQSLRRHLGSSRPETILIVDDDEDFVALLRSFLRGERVTILQAFTVKEALEIIESGQPDVVIMDVLMPGMDGFGFVERLRGAQRNIPTLVVTALELSPEEREELRLGLTRYVSKRQLSRREFREEVRQLLRSLRTS